MHRIHPIDEIIEERCPKLMSKKFLWSAIKPTIFKIFKYQTAKNITDDISDISGFECFNYLTNLLKFNLDIRNIELVPKNGPIILAGNHPTGLTDGIVMFEVMKDRRPDYTLYANIDMIKLSKGFEDIIIPVDWNDDNKNIGKSKEILKRTKETLNEGKCLLVFPSSRLSKRKGFKLFERPWLNTVVKLSKKYNAPIVPFHMDGHNSLFYYFLDIFNEELKNISLFNELLNKEAFKYTITFGHQIDPLDINGDINKETSRIQNHVEFILGNPPLIL
ncbi:MAG: 1-acyl-sn-glycerol-3-phosphate acyltransferase [Alphaproteobacteria bacterium]